MKLYLGDCLEILPTLPAQSVDAIITDLPYGTTQCKWDTIIPFVPMWNEVKRILKPLGVFITTANQPFTSKLIMSNMDWFRQEAIWDKVLPVGFLDANRRLMRAHENIVIFSAAGYSTFNPQMTRRGKPRAKGNSTHDINSVYGYYEKQVSFNNEYYPTTVITVNNGDRTRQELAGHPTQKPVSLYKYLINTYTNPRETVLDFTMGSGTTGVAAVQLGRDFIGCEIDAGYFAIAEKRIYEATLQPSLFRDPGPVAANVPLIGLV